MSRCRVLVADDDPDQLDVVTAVVARLGVDVVRAVTGGELLDKIANAGPFDLIVTDVSMPWMTGVQAMQFARTAGVQGAVVVMTALRDGKTAEQVAALGEDVQLLYKPFSIEALRTAVRSSLRHPVQESA